MPGIHREPRSNLGTAAPVPGLRGQQVVCATPVEAAEALADRLAGHVGDRLQIVPEVHLAISGGSSGALLCDALAADLRLPAQAWHRAHLWMVDERCVPPDDARLNFALLRDRLAPLLGLPHGNLHPMPVMLADGAEAYQRELEAALASDGRPLARLDAVVLGMGSDGHTASLFPGSAALDQQTRLVVTNDGETVAPPRPRMTLTYPVLGQARLILPLVTGASKRPALARLAGGQEDLRSLPMAGVVPASDSAMVWFLDYAALPSRA
jgi:6-phosphogluconolactonase